MMNENELTKYTLDSLPDHYNKDKGSVIHDIMFAVAAGILEVNKKQDAKKVAEQVMKSLRTEVANHEAF